MSKPRLVHRIVGYGALGLAALLIIVAAGLLAERFLHTLAMAAKNGVGPEISRQSAILSIPYFATTFGCLWLGRKLPPVWLARVLAVLAGLVWAGIGYLAVRYGLRF